MYIYIYIYIYIYKYIYIYIYIGIYIYICNIHLFRYIHIYIYMAIPRLREAAASICLTSFSYWFCIQTAWQAVAQICSPCASNWAGLRRSSRVGSWGYSCYQPSGVELENPWKSPISMVFEWKKNTSTNCTGLSNHAGTISMIFDNFLQWISNLD